MKKLILLSSLCALFILAACSGPAAALPSQSWAPLAVGNWWLYDVSGFTIEDTDTIPFSYQNEVRIINLIEHSSGLYVYQQRTISHFNEIIKDTTFTYLHQTSEELRSYAYGGSSASYLELSFPLYQGKTWYYEEEIPVSREVINITSTVPTPAGIFSDCACIHETWDNLTDYGRTLYYNSGVGLVKRTITYTGTEGTSVLNSCSVQ